MGSNSSISYVFLYFKPKIYHSPGFSNIKINNSVLWVFRFTRGALGVEQTTQCFEIQPLSNCWKIQISKRPAVRKIICLTNFIISTTSMLVTHCSSFFSRSRQYYLYKLDVYSDNQSTPGLNFFGNTPLFFWYSGENATNAANFLAKRR